MNTTSLTTIALTVGLLTACAPTTPSQPPPKPSPTCTPETGGPETPCTQHQHDQMITKDKLYTQAETVYRKYLAEDERINRAGGITTPSPVLLETTTGDYLKNSMEIYRELRRIKATAVGGEYKVAWIRRVPGESMNGAVIAMMACIDTSSVQMGSKGTTPEPGLITQLTGYFAQVGSALRLTTAEYQVVTKC